MSTEDSDKFPLGSSHNNINNSQHYGIPAMCHNLLVVTPEAGSVCFPLSAIGMMKC